MASTFARIRRTIGQAFRTQAIGALLFGALSVSCTTVKTAEDTSEFGSDLDAETQAAPQAPQKTAVLPIPATRSGKGTGGVLLITEFRGRKAAGLEGVACRWRMVNRDNGKSYFINLAADNEATYSAMEPGRYTTGRLGCGVSKIWDLEGVFKEGFVIEEDKVSYLGKLAFEFTGREMKEVKKAPRVESAEAFVVASQAVPPESGEIISGFTGRPISIQMVRTGELREGFDVLARGLNNASGALSPLVSTLRTCATKEGLADPLRFGQLEYVAIYRQGRFTEMRERRDDNAFSDSLRLCIERGIMVFQTPTKTEFEIRVRY